MKAGVYLISNNVNGKCYVGSSIHLEQRRKEHFSRLANNKHANRHLQNSYNKYGREVFDFEILEEVEINDNIKQTLLNREQFWIDNLKPQYNILLVAGSTLGYRHTEDTKLKISKSTRGRKKSKEHAQHIREGQRGRKLSDEHKKKLSEAAKKRTKTCHQVAVIIDGVWYNSIKEASIQIGVKYQTIQLRIKNPKFTNYQYAPRPQKIKVE